MPHNEIILLFFLDWLEVTYSAEHLMLVEAIKCIAEELQSNKLTETIN